jgi:hypothetical protein
MLSVAAIKSARRAELVVLVSHEVAKRGWTDVRPNEVCKIPGVGPVSPEVAKRIACDAFLTGVFFDGQDLRHMRRWTRNIPVEVFTALELGEPPEFDGIKMHRLRESLPDRERPPRTAHCLRPRLDRQSAAALLSVSHGQDPTRPQVGKARGPENEDRPRGSEIEGKSGTDATMRRLGPEPASPLEKPSGSRELAPARERR